MSIFEPSPTKDKWGDANGDNTKKYLIWGVLALAALWLLKKVKLF